MSLFSHYITHNIHTLYDHTVYSHDFSLKIRHNQVKQEKKIKTLALNYKPW